MPTTHVSPESQEDLAEIANGLLKARKVIVVTGAGISTNSGIPVSFLTLLLRLPLCVPEWFWSP
jgi:hypothetical protein